MTDYAPGDYVRFRHHDKPALPVFRLRERIVYDHDAQGVCTGFHVDGLERVVAASHRPYELGTVLDFDPRDSRFIRTEMPTRPVPARSARADRSGSRRRTP